MRARLREIWLARKASKTMCLLKTRYLMFCIKKHRKHFTEGGGSRTAKLTAKREAREMSLTDLAEFIARSYLWSA